jgi:hypothetical protein
MVGLEVLEAEEREGTKFIEVEAVTEALQEANSGPPGPSAPAC